MLRFAILCLALVATEAHGQITLGDLKKQVEARTNALGEFEEILNSGDPATSLAAMQLMIEKGDADQRRMAIRHGLYSPDTAIRQTVLRAIFNSNPSLVIEMTPIGAEKQTYYQRMITNWQGTLKADNTASILMRITSYSDEEACWKYTAPNNYEYCGVRMSGEVVSLGFGSSWGQYSLNNEGVLVGSQSAESQLVNATVNLAE